MFSGLTRRSAFLLCALACVLAGCRAKPAYRVGDYLSPIGNSDANQIVKVLAVNSDSYWVEENTLQPTRVNYLTRKRGEIDGRYVRVDPSDFDRTKNPPPRPSPTPIAAIPTAAPTVTPTTTSTPTSTPQPTASRATTLDLARLSASVEPAIVIVSVFDSSGKLLRSGTGFFVSDDGRVATTWRTVEGGMNAVVKKGDGTISNVSGVLAGSTALDLAILKTEAAHPSAIAVKKSSLPEAGAHLAVIGSTLNHADGAPMETTVAGTRSDVHGDLLNLDGSLPRSSAGAPTVDEKGEIVGIVTSPADKTASPNSIRSAAAIASMISSIVPAAVPAWPAKASSAGLFVTKPKPTPTPHEPKLLYTPSPSSPFWMQLTQPSITGRYIIQFGADGNVINVQIAQSMRNATLDNAAVDALRRWRSEPGRAWQKTVPVVFNRPR